MCQKYDDNSLLIIVLDYSTFAKVTKLKERIYENSNNLLFKLLYIGSEGNRIGKEEFCKSLELWNLSVCCPVLSRLTSGEKGIGIGMFLM